MEGFDVDRIGTLEPPAERQEQQPNAQGPGYMPDPTTKRILEVSEQAPNYQATTNHLSLQI
jgi:hypothetical protein